METKDKIYLIVILIGIFFIYLTQCRKEPIKEAVDNYEKLNDSTTYYKNKYNQIVATNSVLETTNAANFLTIQTNNIQIIELQNLVKKYKKELNSSGSAASIGTESTVTQNTPTQVVLDSNKQTNIYKSSYTDKWINYTINAAIDSIKLDLTLTDQFSCVIGEKRPQWFRKKVTFVDVITDNPYTKIKSVRALKVEQKQSRLGIGLQVGYGITLFKLEPYVGVGLQYNILKL